MSENANKLTSYEIIRKITGDKWKFLIICHLFKGPKRYGKLHYFIGSITKKVLTENLRELEKMRIIKRTQYPGSVYHVEYSLTAIGCKLQPIFQSLIIWGLNYSHDYRERQKSSEET